MKNFSMAFVALALFAFIGCGPSAEQQKMFADLTTEVTSMVNDGSASLGKMDDVAGQITTAVTGSQELAQKFPKDTASIMGAVNQLKAAKDRLMSVKDNVGAWIANFKAPDLASGSFDKVIADLKKNKEDITSATTEIQGALSAATSALDGYNGIASGLMSKVASMRK